MCIFVYILLCKIYTNCARINNIPRNIWNPFIKKFKKVNNIFVVLWKNEKKNKEVKGNKSRSDNRVYIKNEIRVKIREE